MTVRDKILVVEDDSGIRKLLGTILKDSGYEVLDADIGEQALALINSHCPDLIILDLGLPDIDGNSIIESVREWTQIPIIVISARIHEGDKVLALDKGADDYITKPFSPAEVLARVRVAMRHTRTGLNNSVRFRTGELEIDYDSHRVYVDSKEVHLTQIEYKLLSIMSRNSGKVLTYDYLMKEIWGPMSVSGNNQILRVNMANIRRKIEVNPAQPKYIYTEVGVGYRMAEED